jgi:hypothetical protein
MAEDKKKKPGLHKRISSIFEGVPLPQPGSLPPPPASPGGPVPESTGEGGGIPQKLVPPPFQTIRAPLVPRQVSPLSPQATAGQPKADASKAGGAGLWQRIKDKFVISKPGASGTRQKVMLVLVPVLIVVFIFVVSPLLLPPKKVPKTTQAKPPTTVAGASTEIKWEVPPPYPETLRDPMQTVAPVAIPDKTEPEKVETVKPENPVVKGILYSADNPAAIIGTQIVHAGDKISGATVVKINKGSVEFEMDGKKWEQNVEP